MYNNSIDFHYNIYIPQNIPIFEGFSLLSTRFTEPLASLNSSQNYNNICNIINTVEWVGICKFLFVVNKW